MVTILSYFDPKQGPKVIETYPEMEITEDIQNISNELDKRMEEGIFFTKDAIKTINYLFFINSEYSRGGQEVLLLSCIITETIHDEDTYRKRLKHSIEEFKKEKEIYKAFHPDMLGHQRELERLRAILQELDNEIRSRMTSTIGYLSRGDDIYQYGMLPIHSDVKANEEEIKESASHTYLIIYKENADKSFSIKGIPVNSEHLYKLEIFTDAVDMWMLKTVTQGFKERLGAKIITTSGICQHSDVCTFEIYFEYEGKEDMLDDFRLYLKKTIPSNSNIYPIIQVSGVDYGSINFNKDRMMI